MIIWKFIIKITMYVSLIGLFVTIFQFSMLLGFLSLVIFSFLIAGVIIKYEEEKKLKSEEVLKS